MSKGAQYTSHMTIDNFLTVLSDCVETAVPGEVHRRPCVGVLCNESMDIANLKVRVAVALINIHRTVFLDVGKRCH